jgi:hypothetical protein
MLVGSIKEQQQQIDALKAELKTLKRIQSSLQINKDWKSLVRLVGIANPD